MSGLPGSRRSGGLAGGDRRRGGVCVRAAHGLDEFFHVRTVGECLGGPGHGVAPVGLGPEAEEGSALLVFPLRRVDAGGLVFGAQLDFAVVHGDGDGLGWIGYRRRWVLMCLPEFGDAVAVCGEFEPGAFGESLDVAGGDGYIGEFLQALLGALKGRFVAAGVDDPP